MMNDFDRNIWTVEGPKVSFFGFPYPTRSVVIRLEEENCAWIWSPVELNDELVSEIESKAGPVKHIVSPNKIHHLFLKSWADRFPEAKVYFPPGLEPRKEAEGIRFDATFGVDTELPFSNEIDVVIVRGSYFMEEVEFFHKSSKTAIITDFVQRFPEECLCGWKGTLMKLDGMAGESGSAPREWRFSFWPFGKEKLREARDEMLNWKAEKLVIAHGMMVEKDATAAMERAFSWI